MKTLIEPTTSAKTKSLYIPNDQFVSVAHDGLAGSEKITFKIELDGTFVPIVPEIALDASTNYLQIAGPNTYEVSKDATIGAVGVYVRT